MSDCIACVCKYDYLTLCEPVSDCTKKLFIYVGFDYSDVLMTVQNIQTKQAKHMFSAVDGLGYAVFGTSRKFLNCIEGGRYRLNVIDPQTQKQICLEYECKLTQNIIFDVKHIESDGNFLVNEPCIKPVIECTTVINLNSIECTTIINLCANELECITNINLN